MGLDEVHVRFKMVLFGKEAVGKTSLVNRFVHNKFEENYLSTLGYNVNEKVIQHENLKISLLIFDIGGQEKFRDLRKKYADGADVAFIIYDITDKGSFDLVPEWQKDLAEFTKNAAFVIIGNKVDLEDERQVSTEDAMKLSKELGALAFLETSAKTGKGVEDAFKQLALKKYEQIQG